MPNPYAPKPRQIIGATFPEGRLRRLGALEDELATGLALWHGMNPDEQQAAADAMAAVTDEELAEQIVDGRSTLGGLLGGPESSLAVPGTEPEPALLGVVPPPEGGEAVTAPGGGPGADPSPDDDKPTTDQRLGRLLDWIGQDVGRADEALAAELARDPKPRDRRVEALQALAIELRG